MSNEFNFLENLVEQKLLSLHTAYLARVVRYDEETATWTIKPLQSIKQKGYSAEEQAIVKDVHTLKNVKEDISEGSIVLCVVCERDITSAIDGQIANSSNRRHDMSDSIIVGVVE